MTAFTPRSPEPIIYGFTAGVIRITWARDKPYVVTGCEGQMFAAEIAELDVAASHGLPTEVVRQALSDLVVRAPDDVLSRITGVEMFCTHHQGVGATLGILLVPLNEN